MAQINLNIIRKNLSQAEIKLFDKVLLGEKIPPASIFKLYKKIAPLYDKYVLIDEISFSDARIKSYLNEIRKLNIPVNILEAIGLIYYYAGDHNFNIGNNILSEKLFFRSYLIFCYLKNINRQSACLNNIGNVYSHLGLYAKALEMHSLSLKLKEKVNDKLGVASSLNNIGNIFIYLKDYDKSVEYYKRALNIYKVDKDEVGEATTLHNMGIIYYYKAKFEKALYFFDTAFKIRSKLDLKAGMAHSLSNMGLVYSEQKKIKPALEKYFEAFLIQKSVNDNVGLAYTYMSLAKVFLLNQNITDRILNFIIDEFPLKDKIKNCKNAAELTETMLKLGFNIVNKLSLNSLTSSYQELYSEYYSSNGNYKKALEHFKLFHESEKNIFNIESEGKIKQMQSKLEIEYERQKAEMEIYKNKKLKNLNNKLSLLVEQLNNANDEKDELISITAHDLKNPVGSIRTISELLIEEPEMDFEERINYYKDIRLSSQTVLDLINKLLSSHVLEQGKIELQMKNLNLSEILKSIVNINKIKSSHKNINVKLSLPKKNVFTISDKEIITQIFDNLISNAIKYSPDGSEIIISMTVIPSLIKITFKDSGYGIPKENIQLIFEKFAKLKNNNSKSETSSGIGLYVVKKFLDILGYSIEVSSKPGKGSEFSVLIPKSKMVLLSA